MAVSKLDFAPALLLEEPGVVKVEAFFDRVSGRRGAVIVSFSDPACALNSLKCGNCSSEVWRRCGRGRRKIYSRRSSSSVQRRVQTWWAKENVGGGGSNIVMPCQSAGDLAKLYEIQERVWRKS